jgi:glycine/D-amino acid oxidase-like deaminating enzyme
MEAYPEIRRVAIVGTGVIGSSWAAYYLALHRPALPQDGRCRRCAGPPPPPHAGPRGGRRP